MVGHHRVKLARTLLMLLMLTGNCRESPDAAIRCDPSVARNCQCTGGASGLQFCLGDGSGWGTCNCDDPDTRLQSDSGNADAMVGPDESTAGQGVPCVTEFGGPVTYCSVGEVCCVDYGTGPFSSRTRCTTEEECESSNTSATCSSCPEGLVCCMSVDGEPVKCVPLEQCIDEDDCCDYTDPGWVCDVCGEGEECCAPEIFYIDRCLPSSDCEEEPPPGCEAPYCETTSDCSGSKVCCGSFGCSLCKGVCVSTATCSGLPVCE